MGVPQIVPITSIDDPRVEPFSGVRDRDLAGRDNAFLAESEVVVRVLLTEGRYRVRSLLLEARRVQKMRDVIDSLPDDIPVYVMQQAAMDQLAGFPIHRGVLALADRGTPIAAAALLAPGGHSPDRVDRGSQRPRLVVGLVGLSNHDNVGGIFRSAAAFAIDGVVCDSTTCDPLYRKAIRVSVGGALVMPFARCESEGDLLSSLAAHDYELVALTPRGEIEIDELPPAAPGQRRALLLGAEGPGLSDAVLAKTRRVRIDMGGVMDSLNVSVACGIALHALRTRNPRV